MDNHLDPDDGALPDKWDPVFTIIGYTHTETAATRKLGAWGEFVASHHIPVLLSTCLCISLISLTVLSPFNPLGVSLYAYHNSGLLQYKTRDLNPPWQAIPEIVHNQNPHCWNRIPKSNLISVQQFLVGFAYKYSGEHGAMDRKTLDALNTIELHLRSSLRPSCITAYQQDGCITLSPMQFWNGSVQTMLGDSDITSTIAHPASQSSNFLPSVVNATFTHRKAAPPSSEYAVVTAFIRGSANWTDVSHAGKEAAAKVENARLVNPLPESSSPQYILKLNPRDGRSSNSEDAFVFYLGCLICFFYIYIAQRDIKQVASKRGLALSAASLMATNAVISYSICKLVGVKFDAMPKIIIPFLAIVLPTDNMLVLTHFTSSTPSSLPVKVRVAQGLSNVGASIFMTLWIELLVLWGFYQLSDPSIQELAVFGGVILCVDFIMEMTFFLPILSMDMQRLELADLLRSLGRSDNREGSADPTKETLPRIAQSLNSAVKARAARTSAFLLLVLFYGYNYIRFGSEHFLPSFCANEPRFPSLSPLHLSPSATPAENLWHALNPIGASALHVQVNTPIIIALDPALENIPDPHLSEPRLRWIFIRHVLMPTIVMLIGLTYYTNYLFRDRRQLKNTLINKEKGKSQGVGFAMVATAHEREISCIAEWNNWIVTHSEDDNALTLSLRPQTGKRTRINDIKRFPIPKPWQSRFTSLSIHKVAPYLAALHESGQILVYDLFAKRQDPLQFTALEQPNAPTVAICDPSSPYITVRSSLSPEASSFFLDLRADGSLYEWDCIKKRVNLAVPPCPHRIEASFITSLLDDGQQMPMIIWIPQLATISSCRVYYRNQEGRWSHTAIQIPATNEEYTAFTFFEITSAHKILAITAKSSKVYLWRLQNPSSTYLGSVLNGDYTISSFSLATTANREQCETCISKSLIALYSCPTNIHTLKLSLEDSSRTPTQCTCQPPSTLSSLNTQLLTPRSPTKHQSRRSSDATSQVLPPNQTQTCTCNINNVLATETSRLECDPRAIWTYSIREGQVEIRGIRPTGNSDLPQHIQKWEGFTSTYGEVVAIRSMKNLQDVTITTEDYHSMLPRISTGYPGYHRSLQTALPREIPAPLAFARVGQVVRREDCLFVTMGNKVLYVSFKETVYKGRVKSD